MSFSISVSDRRLTKEKSVSKMKKVFKLVCEVIVMWQNAFHRNEEIYGAERLSDSPAGRGTWL